MLAFQESPVLPQPWDEWLQGVREGVEGPLRYAAEESEGFRIDIGAALASLL